MNIDIENLRSLTAIVEDLGASMREKILSVSYSAAEVEETHELVRRMSIALKWTVNYFDYYETYKESNPVLLLLEIDNLHKQMSQLPLAAETDSIESIMDDPGD
jgi:hypothetical protein